MERQQVRGTNEHATEILTGLRIQVHFNESEQFQAFCLIWRCTELCLRSFHSVQLNY